MNEKLRNMKMKKKLIVCIRLVAIMFLVAILLTFTGSTLIKNNFQRFYEGTYLSASKVRDFSENVQQIGKNILWATNTEDEALTQERINAVLAAIGEMQENETALKETFTDQTLLGALDQATATMETLGAEVIELAASNRNTEALALYDGEFTDAQVQLEEALDNIQSAVDVEADAGFISSQYLALVIFILMLLLTISCIVASFQTEKALLKSILEPVEELEDAAAKLAAGDLDITIAYTSEDELGQLAGSFRETCRNLQRVISDLKNMMEQLKDGNFKTDSECPESYVGDFRDIHNDLQDMVNQLSGVMEHITVASEQVALGSSQMAESAQALAEGATDQAGAVEELTATIENMASEAQNSAEYAASAFGKAEEYRRQADMGNREMEELAHAMERISEASQEVQNIIGEIEDIASQTNLLSLNASIEAARAGEAGRGFAVVADQIGKLAASSGESAVRTRELIQKTLEEIASGTNMTERTKAAFDQIVEGIDALAEAARQSSETSSTQVNVMNQVETGIEQISNVVQSNSAAAQETSAASEELSAQATTLQELVGRFQLRG